MKVMNKPEKACNTKVTGRVQRVGYRHFILETAQELGIAGHVENQKDGSVTMFAQGEEKTLNQFINQIKTPPKLATIKSFEVEEAEVNPEVRFVEIKFGSMVEELQEGFGSMEKEFRDYREEFRDYGQEFRDYREEFRDYREEFRDYRQEFRVFTERTDQNFDRLDKKYGEISERLTQVLETLQKESVETRKELKRAVDALTELVKQFIGKQTTPNR
jgi:acylphosphatase